MDKSKFFEIAIKVLANEADKNEKDQLTSFLKVENYNHLYRQLEEEWDKSYRYSEKRFDYQRGLQKLKDKVKQQEEIQSKKLILYRSNASILQAAAIIVFALLIFSLFNVVDSEHEEISRFAQSIQCDNSSANTHLILAGKREYEIDSKESEINYVKSSGKVIIDEKRAIDRLADENTAAYNTIFVPFGRRSKVILADGSIVWVNSGSKFIYPANFTQEKREVYLEGEAMFDVSHQEDSPFVVVTPDLNIEVLGTVFNVCAYKDNGYTSAVLERGSIEINYDSQNLFQPGKLKITPGTLVQYDPVDQEITQQKVNTKYYTAWRDGMLIYKNEYLAEIVKQLKRYYNCDINIADETLTSRSFTGKLDLKDDVADVLATLAFVSSIKINQSGNHFIIKQ
ncbi:FecR family protein [Sunxiuqinia indica]|uniref:FecR family protein n=1 Tax=Sunxiuqinia indica TaxID=2692584 RepID=UPI00135C01F7|nr:FecR domain-containing protein [Sunxiuqinia indica]